MTGDLLGRSGAAAGAAAERPGVGPAVDPRALPSENRLQPCCQAMPPEHFEHCRLVAVLTDRDGRRYVSPLGDRRQHTVLCSNCLTTRTMARDGLCDGCAISRAVHAFQHLDRPAWEAMYGQH